MHRILKILLTQFRQLSFSELITLILKNLYQSDSLLIYEYNLMDFTKDSTADLSDYDILKGTLTDLETAKKRITPIPWEFQCNLFDSVTDFFIAKDCKGIHCICWIYYAKDRNRILKLKPNEAEIKFCLTLPDARGKGLYPMVIKAILEYLKAEGLTHVYMCVLKDNKSSIRGIEKAGFECFSALTLRKLIGFQISKRLETSEV